MEQKSEFRSISLKAGLVTEIQRYLKSSKRYRSLADFVSEAARLRLEELEKAQKVDISAVPAAC